MQEQKKYPNALKQGVALKNGNYTIDRVLGAGGFGITYIGTKKADTAFGESQKVVIKELFLSVTDYNCTRDYTNNLTVKPQGKLTESFEDFKNRFKNEALTLHKFRHLEGMVKVLDYFEENDTNYFTMDYIEAQTLKDYVLDKGGLPIEEALRYINDIGKLLSALHEKKVMHRDIKPENILIDDNKKVYLIDFGIAKKYDDTGIVTQITGMGTNRYAPPEQLLGLKDLISFAMDVYGLASTLYYFLTSKDPQTSDEENIYGKKTILDFCPDISPEINEAIEKGRVKRVQERIQSVEDFLKKLEIGKKDPIEESVAEDNIILVDIIDNQNFNPFDKVKIFSLCPLCNNQDEIYFDTAIKTKYIVDKSTFSVVKAIGIFYNCNSCNKYIYIDKDSINAEFQGGEYEILGFNCGLEVDIFSDADHEEPKIETQQDFFNRYKIDKEQGPYQDNSYSTIHAAEDIIIDKCVTILEGCEMPKDSKYTLMNQFKLTSNLKKHKNIILLNNCYRFGNNSTVIDYGVMDYFGGAKFSSDNSSIYNKDKLIYLTSLIDEKVLNFQDKRNIIFGILEGINHLHANNIIHRGLSAGAFLMVRIEKKWLPKIDLGVVSILKKDLNISHEQVYPPISTPPEALAKGEIKPNVDIWAIGIIVYQLFTGKFPFDSEDYKQEEIFRKIINDKIPPEVNAIPEPYSTIVKQCLIKDNKKRPQSARELIDILNNNSNSDKEVTIIKSNNENTQIEIDHNLSDKPAEWFNTPERRKIWWNQLEDQWKKAFNEIMIDQHTISKLDDNSIIELFEKTELRALGPDGYISDDDKKDGLKNLNFKLSNLSGCENLTRLTWLRCSENQISSIKGIENLLNLDRLNCSSNQLFNLRGIENLSNLTALYCSSNQLSSLKGIENLSNLHSLNCDSNQVSNFRGIENLTNLRSLHYDNNQISSLKGIENLTNLKFFSCGENQISSLSGIENLTNLISFSCHTNQISSLNGIESLTNLKLFDCGGNQLISLNGIEYLNGLTTFSCWSNHLTSLNGIENLTGLKRFACHSSNLSNLKALQTLLKNHKKTEISIDVRLNPIRKISNDGFLSSKINEAEYLKKKYPWIKIEY